MGFEYGDAQNLAVRVFLNQFSKKFDTYFDKHYKKKTLAYFDNRCPYSGHIITKNNSCKDHIIPFNRKHCGLHLYGNVLIVTKQANSTKHGKLVKDFLQDSPEKLEKIKSFMNEGLFLNIHEQYKEQLTAQCEFLYHDIRTIIEKYTTNVAAIV